MDIVWIILGILVFVILAMLLITYVCFRITFYVPKKRPLKEEFDIPKGKIYEPYRDAMVKWMKEVRAMPHKTFSITSFDGLTLQGKFYEYAPSAPIELMFPGYRGSADRDLCGGVQRCFALKRSALIVDQRACDDSEGTVISFGVNEHRDCLAWVDFMVNHFGPDVKIILTGISMGASTVIMAAGFPLPSNVVGVLADCGFTSAKDIIQVVIRVMKLPPKLTYPFVKFGAKLFGHFDLEDTPAVEAIKNCRVPVILFHGEADDFVPCYMSRENYEACPSTKKLVTIPGAGHGLSYLVAPEKYLDALSSFFDPLLTDSVSIVN